MLKLVKLGFQGGTPQRHALKVAQLSGVADRRLDIRHDVRRQVQLPGGVVELQRVVAQVFVVEENADRGCPEKRAEVPLGGALGNHRENVGRIGGRSRQARVLEAIHVVLEPTPDFLKAVRVCHDRQVMRVSLLDHRPDFVFLHQVLINELDDIDAGRGQFP